MGKRLLLCCLAIAFTFGCKSTSSQATLTDTEIPLGIFVGCVPFMGECTVSCPERNGVGRRPDALCRDDASAVACYCPADSVGPPVVDGSQWEFKGCVMSANECTYSANDPERIYVVADPNKCPRGAEPPLACYHLRDLN